MGYEMDMSNEGKGNIFPEGERKFKITACREAIAKSSGNDMFVFIFTDILTSQEAEVYAIAVKGKRWYLKSILAACGVAAAEDGIYNWDIPDVIDKFIAGIVTHYKDDYINNKGKKVETTKQNISDIEETQPF